MNEKAIKVHIGEAAEASWGRLIAFWLPAVEAGQISRETFLEKTPGIDVPTELQRLEKEKESQGNGEDFMAEALDVERAERIEEAREVSQEE